MLAAADVIRPAGEGRVGHDVDGQRGDVGGLDHAADRERGAELIAAVFEGTAERRRRRGESMKPAAIWLTRSGANSSARLAISADIAAVTAETIVRATSARQPSMALMNTRLPPGLTLPAALRVTSIVCIRARRGRCPSVRSPCRQGGRNAAGQRSI